jgi:hypothetical protein
MKPEYRKDQKEREKFERTMAALFQVKKSELEKKPKPEHKKTGASKD